MSPPRGVETDQRPLHVVGAVDERGRELDMAIVDGRLTDPQPGMPRLDASGLTVAPGFIDLQINGAFGHDFTEDPASIWDVGAKLPRTGVTSFCPTIITSPADRIAAAQEAMRRRPDRYVGAEPIGLHIEGPHLAPDKRGVHPEDLLAPPDRHRMTLDDVAIVTLAPELPGAIEFIASLVAGGVVASIGHSQATTEEAEAAVEAGATLGTHLFNAMRPIAGRDPGVAGVLLTDERASFSVICDGHHLHAVAVALAWRTAPDRFVLVTDAISLAGTQDRRSSLGSVGVTVSGGVPINADGALAGSVTTMDASLRVLAGIVGVPVASVIRAATRNPARALRRTDLGRLEHGARGDVTLIGDERVVGTIVGGRIAHLDEDRLVR